MAIRPVDEIANPPLLSLEELRARLRQVGEERYHHRHPFHQMMHEGRLTRGQLQAWALNRYYYQSRIPMKDAIILSRSEDAAFRRAWRKRVVDHDGDGTSEGGIKRWLKLAEATGLEPGRVARGDDRRRFPLRHTAARGSRHPAALFGVPAENRPRSNPAQL